MFADSQAFSDFSSNDRRAAKEFYGKTRGGLEVTEENGMLTLKPEGGQTVLIYPKDDHQAATYTTLNFPVKEIEAAVDRLTQRGIALKHYGEGRARTSAQSCAPMARRSPGSSIPPATSSR